MWTHACACACACLCVWRACRRANESQVPLGAAPYGIRVSGVSSLGLDDAPVVAAVVRDEVLGQDVLAVVDDELWIYLLVWTEGKRVGGAMGACALPPANLAVADDVLAELRDERVVVHRRSDARDT